MTPTTVNTMAVSQPSDEDVTSQLLARTLRLLETFGETNNSETRSDDLQDKTTYLSQLADEQIDLPARESVIKAVADAWMSAQWYMHCSDANRITRRIAQAGVELTERVAREEKLCLEECLVGRLAVLEYRLMRTGTIRAAK